VTQRLIQAFVDAAPVTGKDYIVFDSQLSGLGLRVTPTGKKIFIAQAYVARRKRRITVGYSPDISLSKARVEAQQMLAAMKRGIDATADQKARLRAAQAQSITLRELSERWVAEFVISKLKPRTASDYQQVLSQHVLPALGNLTVAEIDHEQIERRHREMKATPRRANYMAAVVRSMLSFAIKRGLRSDNPATGITRYRERKRERFLSASEFAAAAEGINRAENGGGIGPFAAAGLRLALLTGARSGEVTSAKWEHLDRERKLIRLPDSKNNEPRTIHLSDAALEVLRNIPRVGPYIIQGGRRGQPYKHLTRAWIIARGYAGLDDVRLHDLRHSYASLAVSQGIPLFTVGKMLGHRDTDSTQRYAHLARDVVQEASDRVGAAMQAAIARGERSSQLRQKPRSNKVVKLTRGGGNETI
jgi:integrase